MNSAIADRLKRLRDEMLQVGVDGYIVPRADEFLGEYVPPSAERLAWLTGFTGSAGAAVILRDAACVLSDSRYTLALRTQTDRRYFQNADSVKTGIAGWLKAQNAGRITIGFDPALHSVASIKRIETELDDTDITLKPITGNLIDAVWTDRPKPPRSSVEPFLETIAGRTSGQKREMIADELTRAGLAAAVLPDPADMAWLLNIRGRDVPHTPFALSTGIIYADASVDWVIDPMRISLEVKRSLGNAVRIVPPEQVDDMIMKLKVKVGKEPVLIDPSMTSYKTAQMLDGRNVIMQHGKNPVLLPRACKTAEEKNAMRDAHRKDAVAMIGFLAWLDAEWPGGKLDELSIADKLLSLRKIDPAFRDTSFDTIAGMGANGAIVHYKATEETNKKIKPDGLLLVDSGAQYACGTTDITRTIAIGEVTDAMRMHYTAVLKSHIAFAAAVIAKGATGAHIDAISRAPLWAHGMDFGHRVGHGVGCYLSVHEPAVDLSARGLDPIMPGMIVSNEPGYYREGEYGIRLENVVVCVPSTRVVSGDQIFYEFETLTLVPFDPNLIKLSMLSPDEQDWLAAYHTRILTEIGPHLSPSDRAWLEAVVDYFV